MTMPSVLESGRPPQPVRDDLWLFPPNRDCRGGSSWWLTSDPEPVLIDCPPFTEASLGALQTLAAGRHPRILLTSREGHGRIQRLQERLGWPVLVQEQEAYLLPGVDPLQTFTTTHTTADGVLAKYRPGDYEFDLPEAYRAKLEAKDYGPYTLGKGELPVCFLAANHTSGGNSGSPAFNARGELIGLNFDRVWEGTMSDFYFTPQRCRNIMVDIRYVLWVVDRYAGADRLIEEMNIVR